MKFVIGGNWKMNMGINASIETAKKMVEAMKGIEGVIIFIAPSYTSLVDLGKIFKNTNIKLVGQNMSEFDKGAYTGEISPEWLLEAGCEYVLLGHSERRRIYGEISETINIKLLKALEKGLKPVLCIGETAGERADGRKEEVNAVQLEKSLKDVTAEQMKNVVIAYEPVWAINSRGLNPVGEIKPATPAQAEEMHLFLRKWFVDKYGTDVGNDIPIQYGGSVKPANCAELFKIKDINGGLIGGASLKPEDFSTIAKTASMTEK
ncbi:MAG: triose-phosphate isomerase [archaeon]|nr:triose-phosphate isomerase [archaeon]